jgi:transaldolase
MTPNPNLQRLHEAGVSIWLDTLSRQLLQSGEFAALIRDYSVTGATSNPTIFAKAILHLVFPFYVSNGLGMERAPNGVGRRRRLRRTAVIHVTRPQQRPMESVTISGRFPIPVPYASQIA